MNCTDIISTPSDAWIAFSKDRNGKIVRRYIKEQYSADRRIYINNLNTGDTEPIIEAGGLTLEIPDSPCDCEKYKDWYADAGFLLKHRLILVRMPILLDIRYANQMSGFTGTIFVQPSMYDKYITSDIYASISGRVHTFDETYTPLDYIEKDATHTGVFNDLGVTLKDNTRFELKAYPTQNGNLTDGVFLGQPKAGLYDWQDYRIMWNNNRIYYDYGGERRYASLPINNLYELEIGNYYVKNKLTSDYIINADPQAGISNNRQLCLFGGVDDYDVGNNNYGRIYYLKIYEGDALVKYYIPVRTSSNVVALYDILNSGPIAEGILFPNGTLKGSDEV